MLTNGLGVMRAVEAFGDVAAPGVTRTKAARSSSWRRAGSAEMGGANAPFGVEETILQIVDVLIAQRGAPGLRYLDRNGRTVPW